MDYKTNVGIGAFMMAVGGTALLHLIFPEGHLFIMMVIAGGIGYGFSCAVLAICQAIRGE